MFEESSFVFHANYLCLDFVNTQKVKNGQITDSVSDLKKLLSWLVTAGVLDKEEADRRMKDWDGTIVAEELLEQAHELRSIIRILAESLETQIPVESTIIDKINFIMQSCSGYEHIDASNGKFNRRFVCHPKTPKCLLHPIVESVTELLCKGNHLLIRRCENPNCILYFYDTSKNHSRRWCSMSTCGNRVKVAAHYRRSRR